MSGLARWFEAEGHSQLVSDVADSHADTERQSMDAEDVHEAFFFANMFIYLQLLETTYDAFYVYDDDGRCRVWNRGAARLFNLPATSQLNTQWSAGICDYVRLLTIGYSPTKNLHCTEFCSRESRLLPV